MDFIYVFIVFDLIQPFDRNGIAFISLHFNFFFAHGISVAFYKIVFIDANFIIIVSQLLLLLSSHSKT